jgi:ubiquinone/menaquinone biosynthesis C-methylase UbiE
MAAYATSIKPYKGKGMEGAVAKWYAALTKNKQSMDSLVDLARRTSQRLAAGSSVLEVAPGPGYYAIELAKLGNYRITGLDISKTFVEMARGNARAAGVSVEFRQGNAAEMPFADETFDFLVCRAAFKNFSQPQRAIEEMYRVLKPGGAAVIIDLRRDASMNVIAREVNGMKAGVVNGWITKLTFRFMLLRRAYTKDELERMIAETEFSGVEICEDGMGFEAWLTRGREG